MSDIKEMLGKKPKMQDEDKKMAKLKALKSLREEMGASEKDGLSKAMSMKKVSVMAPDKEKLEEGLDKAKELVEEMPEEMSPAHAEAEEMMEEEGDEEDMSLEDIEELMKELEAKKAALLRK